MPIRVLIVDDSAFMRKAISRMLDGVPEIQVAGTARDGIEAIEQLRALRPDVMTLDVEMPRMDGITALRTIMREHPIPVIMVSSLTTEGAAATVEAMAAGAVDVIPKQLSYVSLDMDRLREELVAKIRAVARSRARLFARGEAPQHPPAPRPAGDSRGLSGPQARLIALGISTGGPFSLQKVIPALPASFPLPVVVVQHMPPRFTKSLADRLDGLGPLPVREAEAGMELQAGHVYVAQGGRHLVFHRRAGRVVLDTPEEPAESLHRPSVDVTFASACRCFDGRVLAVVMTGMGKDGLAGARQIRQAGGKVVAQDEETSVVYGMPRAVVEAGLADAVLPLEAIAGALAGAVRGSGFNAQG